MNPPLPVFSSPQKITSEPEGITIQKQRKELQLLIAELRDRDKELNDMVAVHQRQLLAWEDDRQKILTLAERCSKLENELQKRNELISTLTERLNLLKSQEKDCKVTLETTQQKVLELSQKESDILLRCQDLEEKNHTLSCSVMELSTKVGQLQAREQELLTMLKLKDKDILEATNHITEFTCKFKKLENALRTARMDESSIKRQKQDFKLRLNELILETNKLKGDLSERTKENNEQREEIIRLKQENGYLNSELLLSAERANRKEQLLQSAKSKQLRTDTELNNLRQIYVKQQRDLQFLHFSLESSQEVKQNPKMDAHKVNSGLLLSDLESSGDRDAVGSKLSQKTHCRFACVPGYCSHTACPVSCAENRQRAGPTEKSSASSDQFQEGPFRTQRTLRREDLKHDCCIIEAGEPNDKGAFPSESVWKNDGTETAWASEPSCGTPLPIHEHWLQLDSCADAELSRGQSPKARLFDRAGSRCKDVEPGAGSGPVPRLPPSPFKGLDSACCSCGPLNKGALYHPVSDQEWLHIFKPKEDGSEWSGRQASHGSTGTKTESDPDLTVLDLGAPCLTSTQKTSVKKKAEKLLGPELPLDLTSLTDVQAADGCSCPAIQHDCCSSTSKLQRLLAESRQMVADLELSNLLDARPCCSPHNSRRMVPECPNSLCKGRLQAAEECEKKLSLFSL
uniref:Coiled-coil domain containing 62 n=1 Tax=Salvator merianae TaxID=96440 RepID=A0A8D0E6M7_SALMN